MLCQKCKKNTATVFCKENINGHITEYSLCPECAAEMQIGNPFSIFEDDPISSLFSSFMTQPKITHDEKKCPLCASSFKELVATGKVGCPKCYEVFASELAPTIRQLHAGAKSRGRAPRRYGEKRARELELSKLKADLKAAIDAQEFEMAAELRDKIRALESN